jgi:hypothetical protein
MAPKKQPQSEQSQVASEYALALDTTQQNGGNETRASAKEEQEVVASSDSWPVVKSPRFLSDWDEPVVILDITDPGADRTCIIEIAIEETLLNLNGAEGLYTGMHKLGELPHLVRTMKIAMNSELIRLASGVPGRAINRLMTHGISFIIAMLRRGVYRLSDFPRSDFEKLLVELSKEGWQKILGVQAALRTLIAEARRAPEVLRQLTGPNQKFLNVSENLSDIVGLPISSAQVPLWFSDELSEITGKPHTRTKTDQAIKEISRGNLTDALRAISALANQRETGDFLPFQPAGSITGRAAKIWGQYNRSKNLAPDDAVKIFAASTDWVLDFAPDVIDLAKFARTELLNLPNELKLAEKEKCYFSALSNQLEKFREKHDTKIARFWPENNTPSEVLQQFIEHVQFSATNIISALYALRANDAIGYGRSYGLYHGCVTSVAPGSSTKTIEIFLSKSPREYRSFWATNMVAQIVAVLEALRDAARPLDAPSYTEQDSVKDLRIQKLFKIASLCVGTKQRTIRFRHCKVKRRFLQAIGLDPRAMDGQRAFRRLYAILYVYRFSDARIEALSRRLGHVSVLQTHWYVSDDHMTAYRASIDKYYKKHQAILAKEIKDVQSELFLRQIQDMLQGRDVGGGFSAFVARVVKKLSQNIEFAQQPLREKVEEVHDLLTTAGYHPNDRRHGGCMLGSSKTAKYGANCIEAGVPHPENASLTKCHNCRNGYNTALNLSLYGEDLADLNKKAEDFDLPARLRIAAKAEADDLSALIARERALTAQNRSFFQRLMADWKAASAIATVEEEESID